MRAVIQRVSQASVVSGGRECGATSTGLLVYLGVDRDDMEADVHFLADKIRYLRVFSDESGKLNLDVVQVGGRVLVVSAFTVIGDARRGRRPSFDKAAARDRAVVFYELFCERLAGLGVSVQRGCFGDDMQVQSVNAGPLCILMESRRAF